MDLIAFVDEFENLFKQPLWKSKAETETEEKKYEKPLSCLLFALLVKGKMPEFR